MTSLFPPLRTLSTTNNKKIYNHQTILIKDNIKLVVNTINSNSAPYLKIDDLARFLHKINYDTNVSAPGLCYPVKGNVFKITDGINETPCIICGISGTVTGSITVHFRIESIVEGAIAITDNLAENYFSSEANVTDTVVEL